MCFYQHKALSMPPFRLWQDTQFQTNMHGLPRIVKLLLLNRPWSTAFHRPKAFSGILLTYSSFILKPKIHLI
jgi:hypothetical protein